MTAGRPELVVGYQPAPLVAAPLTITDSVRYQAAAGDFNPMHHDADLARRAGYPAPFAVGMRQASVLAMYLTDWLGIANLRRFKVRFLGLAWPGDVLSYSATVLASRQTDSATFVLDLECQCVRSNGESHLVGWASFELPVNLPIKSPVED